MASSGLSKRIDRLLPHLCGRRSKGLRAVRRTNEGARRGRRFVNGTFWSPAFSRSSSRMKVTEAPEIDCLSNLCPSAQPHRISIRAVTSQGNMSKDAASTIIIGKSECSSNANLVFQDRRIVQARTTERQDRP